MPAAVRPERVPPAEAAVDGQVTPNAPRVLDEQPDFVLILVGVAFAEIDGWPVAPSRRLLPMRQTRPSRA
jgi:hypothetical protein